LKVEASDSKFSPRCIGFSMIFGNAAATWDFCAVLKDSPPTAARPDGVGIRA